MLSICLNLVGTQLRQSFGTNSVFRQILAAFTNDADLIEDVGWYGVKKMSSMTLLGWCVKQK
jgi:hypothetical protein